MFTVSDELVVPVPREPRSPSSPLTMLSRLVTWSPSSLRPSSRLIPALRRWLATAAVVAAAAMAAGVVVVVAADVVVASLPPMPLPLVPTDAGKPLSHSLWHQA
ncbi:hypothetical protein VTN02DRAFT_6265 [Thermoascus thermophilus]